MRPPDAMTPETAPLVTGSPITYPGVTALIQDERSLGKRPAPVNGAKVRLDQNFESGPVIILAAIKEA
ncbi:MAG: hypothetical protein C4582_03555 [Desulfobacteraceae bacterium]|jgi:hypothetical protein|nr:MAG: hypothetical protein C4582_03555 [Desulfobacteraceae bacterium]